MLSLYHLSSVLYHDALVALRHLLALQVECGEGPHVADGDVPHTGWVFVQTDALEPSGDRRCVLRHLLTSNSQAVGRYIGIGFYFLHTRWVVVQSAARSSGLTYYSARKQLNQWTQGNNPKLLKTRRGQKIIYIKGKT